jgi:hypothetical protein
MLIVTQLVKKFQGFNVMWSSLLCIQMPTIIPYFDTVKPVSIFKWFFLNSHLPLTSHLHLSRSGCFFRVLYYCHSHMHTKCLSHFILLNLITWIVFCRVQLWLHSLYIYYPSLYYSFSLSYPNTFLSISSSNAVNVCCSLRVRD